MMEQENAIADRILTFLKVKDLSSGILADRIGVQRSSISHILSGRNKPSYDFIRKFLETFPEVNAEWFITGKGEMLKAAVQQDLFGGEPEISGEEAEKELTESENTAPETIEEPKGNLLPEREEIPAEAAKTLLKGKIVKVILLYEDGHFDSYTPDGKG
jgi:transcriptional regulator with XRE-family HTH domain